MSLGKSATLRDFERVRALDKFTRSAFDATVRLAIERVEAEDEEKKVVVVAAGRDLGDSVARACACAGASAKDGSSGAFGDVSVTRVNACERLKKLGFEPKKTRKYAIKTQELSWPTTTGRLSGLGSRLSTTALAVQSWKREADIARRAGELGVGPVVHVAFVCKGARDGGSPETYGVIVMDALHERLVDLPARQRAAARRKVPRLLDALHADGILHGDAHAGNVMVDKAGRVFIVDYGFATLARDIGAADHDDFALLGDGREPRYSYSGVDNVVARLYSRNILQG